jgi:hypothetical protein
MQFIRIGNAYINPAQITHIEDALGEPEEDEESDGDGVPVPGEEVLFIHLGDEILQARGHARVAFLNWISQQEVVDL